MLINEKTVLVTRPAHQSAHLCSLLKTEGFSPISYPTIKILPPDNSAQAIKLLAHCHKYDYLIFVSANAVLQADLLTNQQWPTLNATLVAIGPKTAGTLQKIGLKPDIISATPFNSEYLLKQLPNKLKQTRSLIIKGEGGRDLLAKQLRKRGMTVDCVDVYKRALPNNPGKLNGEIPAYITITSQLALDNLFLMLPQQTTKFKQYCRFVVFSERIALYAESLGCQYILICQEASDMGLVLSITHDKNDNDF